ncbi:MAG: T9SS type A sorting domain-containing protein [Prevotella sp.]|nr:T9SS type A sorting domain-containing protein [Bacteroides sp.]MCM1366078.1 T9SS type A sorting domain-containing protein [Prevotella sp.]MCM1436563.1 T9SS type A sorting domain-containing protein [Prevotella sp.]
MKDDISEGVVLSEIPEMENGKLRARFAVADKGYNGTENPEDWTAEWIQGIGAVGESYASNPFMPMYRLPKGVTPAYLLYVRNITDNSIIYGNPTLDTEFVNLKLEPEGIESVKSDSPSIIWDNNNEYISAIGEGDINLTAYSVDGKVVAKVSGEDIVSLSKENLPEGVIILKSATKNSVSSFKIIK